eukprot:5109669-Prymnesium_polylepis.1
MAVKHAAVNATVRRKVGAPSGQVDTYPLTSGWDTQTAHMQARCTPVSYTHLRAHETLMNL